MEAFEKLGRDVVVKPLFGAEGRGILRADQAELALRVFRTLERLNATLYLQRFNQGPLGDVRILNEDTVALMTKGREIAGGNRRALGYSVGYCVHTWEMFVMRSWGVAFPKM